MSAPAAMASATAATRSRSSHPALTECLLDHCQQHRQIPTGSVVAVRSDFHRCRCSQEAFPLPSAHACIRPPPPQADGFHMPAEWETHERCYLIWPERTDNWRLGAKPAQAAFAAVAESIAPSEPVTVLASARQWEHARASCSPIHPGRGDDNRRRMGTGYRPHLRGQPGPR